jgi:hypothetical protein
LRKSIASDGSDRSNQVAITGKELTSGNTTGKRAKDDYLTPTVLGQHSVGKIFAFPCKRFFFRYIARMAKELLNKAAQKFMKWITNWQINIIYATLLKC